MVEVFALGGPGNTTLPPTALDGATRAALGASSGPEAR